MDMKLPFLGDGVDSATVLSILVKEGDTVQKEDTLLELETEKAVAPIPSDFAGKITKILVKEGDTVKEGVPIVSLEVEEAHLLHCLTCATGNSAYIGSSCSSSSSSSFTSTCGTSSSYANISRVLSNSFK